MSKPVASFLSKGEIETIHGASLEVLHDVGIRVMSEQALAILEEAGAKVDYGKNYASIPKTLVEEALKVAPKTITYGARNPKYDFVLDKKQPHFCADGDPPFILNWETGERRYSTTQDVAHCALIADYLDHVQLTWVMLTPTEIPAPMQGLVGMCTCLRNTEKHVEDEALNAVAARYQIEIATTIVGDEKRLREKPIISAVQCPFSPLTYDKGITEGAIELGKAGIPIVIYPMPLLGATSPATMAGTVVIGNADFLGGLVIQELAAPGAPVVYSVGTGTMDFKTGAENASPDDSLMQVALGQLAHYYRLPDERPIFYGTSKLLDTQAGNYTLSSLLAHMLIEPVPDIVLGLGGLGGTTSLEAMIIDNEIVDYALRFAQGFEVNDDTLAMDAIRKVGPGGNFLGEKHTLEHFKDAWTPKININALRTWEQEGIESLGKLANEKVKEILATHKPEPLPEDIDKEVSRILKRAETELLNKS